MSIFLGEIKRGHKIPISLSLNATPTGTPTYRILDSARAVIVTTTNLDGSGLLWYKDDQIVATDAAEGEYLIEYTAVIGGTTYYDNDSYEVPISTLTPSSGISLADSSNWTMVRDSIIKHSLRKCGVISEGGEPTAEQYAVTSTELNKYVKRLQQRFGLKLWKLVDTQKRFSAPSEVTISGTIYTCILGHTSSADNQPGVGDNWPMYWTVRGSTGGTWVTSTAYTSTGDFIDGTDLIGVENALLRRESASGPHSDTPIEIVSNNAFFSVLNRTSFGDPIKLFFDHKLSNPTIFLYPQVEDYDDVILVYQKIMRVEDFDASGNTPDFPVDWIDHIELKLTHRMSQFYHLPISEQREFKTEAQEALFDVLYSDNRGKTLKIWPKRR